MGFGDSLRNSMPPVVKNIIIINVIMLVVTMFSENFMYEHFALFYFGSPFFKPYQIITHIFMHGGFWHLFFNMYTLWIFGSVLENMWGGKKFFLYYMVTGLGAALLHEGVMAIQVSSWTSAIAAGDQAASIAMHNLMMTPTVGASGAIYGLLLAYGMMFPNNVMRLIFPPIALKAKWFVIIFGAIELISGLTGAMGGASGDNVAHFAHLGGMLFGVLLILYWKKKNKLYY
jgi:membrane associated rhomboid family serine protease